MVQLNLLPDVKLEYIKAQRSRRLMLSISILVTGIAVVVLVLLLLVDVAQRKHLSDLSRDISSESSTLQQKPDINKILTVQNQLEGLTALHAGKPAASRLFDSYLNQVTPGAASINTFHIDFIAQTVSITGTADALSTINKYVDTLKFTTYTTADKSTATNAFSNIVLSSFGVSSGKEVDKSQAATYTITLAYDKTIFDITKDVKLAVPNLITTRSELDQPGDLFKAAPSSTQPKNGGV
jgi:Na+-transporting methylmalonyl-CoA/oxaloacetate decarboxylase gamma subunit